MERIIKIVLAVMLLLCLADMPYGFYELVRFVAMVGFGVLAFQSYESENTIMLIVYGAFALLFQPFFKIALGRELWNMVDVVVGIGLIVSLFVSKQKDKD